MNFLSKSFTAIKNLFTPPTSRSEPLSARRTLNFELGADVDVVPETPENHWPRDNMSRRSSHQSLPLPLGEDHGRRDSRAVDEPRTSTTPYKTRPDSGSLQRRKAKLPRKKPKELMHYKDHSDLLILLSYLLNMAVRNGWDNAEYGPSARRSPKKPCRPLSEVRCYQCRNFGHYAIQVP